MEQQGDFHDNQDDKSPAATALSAASDQALRVPCYCEENVWRLVHRRQHLQHDLIKHDYVVFVSNPSKSVCFFHQRANSDPSTPVFWDYHVILLSHDTTNNMVNVMDMDSYLPYPCSLSEYLEQTFPNGRELNQEHLERIAPYFRLVSADNFLRHFSSDRSHMWDATRKRWRATPPTYRCIQGSPINRDEKSSTTNLMTYVDMQQSLSDPVFGTVLTRQQLEEKYF